MLKNKYILAVTGKDIKDSNIRDLVDCITYYDGGVKESQMCSISGRWGIPVRVPRQGDNSLELVRLEDSEIVDRLPFGEYIARSGYDWDAEDQADVSIALDLERQQVMIAASDWDGVVVMDIVI